MSIDLWISIAVAIPLAIVANLVTPRFQKWLDARLEHSKRVKIEKKLVSRERQLKRLKSELKDVTKYHNNRTEFNQVLLISLIKIAMYGAIGTIYGSIFPFIAELSSWDGIGGVLGRTGAQMTALLISMLIFMECAKALRLHKSVRDFAEFETNTIQMIKTLEEENV